MKIINGEIINSKCKLCFLFPSIDKFGKNHRKDKIDFCKGVNDNKCMFTPVEFTKRLIKALKTSDEKRLFIQASMIQNLTDLDFHLVWLRARYGKIYRSEPKGL